MGETLRISDVFVTKFHITLKNFQTIKLKNVKKDLENFKGTQKNEQIYLIQKNVCLFVGQFFFL